MSKRCNIPILIGVGQYTQSKDAKDPQDPMEMMTAAGRMALNDTGKAALKKVIDSVYVVNIQSHSYEDAPGMLAAALGIHPKDTFYSALGGNSPQMFVARAAKSIEAGQSRAVLIAGGESVYATRRAGKGVVALNWPEPKIPKRIDGKERQGTSALEGAYGLQAPTIVYPFFETALRADSGRTVEEHRQYMGRICEKLTCVAAKNPYSWLGDEVTGDLLTTPTAENRYIAYPYTKRMVANIFVDQSAALIMTSEEVAEKLGIDRSLWVYPMGKAELNDVWHVSRRNRINESVALRKGSIMALERAGISLDDVGVFDIYSCFPCAVEMGRQAIGIPGDDPRDLSVTGGLPYFGGPVNNYSLHAVATVVERIRKDPSLKAMVTATGWYMTKHAIVVYGSGPGVRPWEDMDDASTQHAIDGEALPEPVEKAEGRIRVEAYTVIHNSSGNPERGIVMGRLENGKRALADIDADPDMLTKWEEMELVGRKTEVRFDPGIGRNRIAIRT